MQYFGVPTCPYCKKRVNLIRTWSLKRQGEYQCPRCGGISNIFLSPLVYVFALLAVFSGGAVYFFHKFILDDVGLTTCLQVLIPFVLFFLLSLFMVYLAKPVIKRVSREENGKKKQGRPTGVEGRRASGSSGQTGQIYVDQEDYLPQKDYRTGPLPQSRPVNAPAPQAVRGNVQPTAVLPQEPRRNPASSVQRRQSLQNTAQQRPVRQPVSSQNPQAQGRVPAARQQVASPAQPARSVSRASQQAAPSPAVSQRQSPAAWPQVQQPVSRQPMPSAHGGSTQEPRRASHVVSSVEFPRVDNDFFAKYDDPSYVERRLKELQSKDGNDSK